MLKELPVYNEMNFTRPQCHSNVCTSVYVPTKDNPESREIVTERRTILLKYLQQKMETNVPKKKRNREVNIAEGNEPIAKRLRSSVGK